MKEKDNSGKIILSLLIGITAGAVAGLLLAPETGEDTRASLKDSAGKLGDDLNKWLQKSQETLDSAKASATNIVGEGRAAADEALASLSEQANMLADKAKQLVSNASGEAQQAAATTLDKAKDAADITSDKVKAATANVKQEAAALEDKAKAKVEQAASPQPTPKVDPTVAKAQANAAKDNTAPAGS